MDQENFPWTPEQDPEFEKNKELNLREIEKKIKRQERFKILYPSIIVVVLVLLIFSFQQPKENLSKKKTPQYAEALVSMIPLQKGQRVDSQTLKLVKIPLEKLTRTQRLNLLKAEDAIDLEGKLHTKKDIPPQKPVLWNELLYRSSLNKTYRNPKISFGE